MKPPLPAPPRPPLMIVTYAILAGAAAAIIAGIAEAIAVIAGAPGHVNVATAFVLAAGGTALVGAAALPAVAVLEGLAALGRASGVPGRWLATLRARAAEDENVAAASGVALLATAASAGATLAALLPLHRLLAELENRDLAAVAGALVGLGAVVIFGAAWLVLFAAGRVVAQRLIRGGAVPRRIAGALRPGRVAVTLGLLGLVAAWLAARRFEEVVRSFRLATWIVGAVVLAALLAGRALLPRWALARRVAARLRPWGAAAVVVALAGGALLLAVRPLARSVRVTALREGYAPLGGIVWPLLAKALDADRDGHARFLGFDCDDANRAIYPGAIDVPGDGIDQDCFDGDLLPALLPRGGVAGDRPASLAHLRNVIVLTVDAMRADRLSTYGWKGPPITPVIDAVAPAGVVFESAYTTAPQTRRAVQSFFSGLYARSILFGGKPPHSEVKPANLMLAERVTAAGIDALAFYGSEYLSRAPGFFQGFDLFDEARLEGGKALRATDVPLADLTSAVIREVKTRVTAKRRFFVWVHFRESHSPYMSEPGWEHFGSDPHGRYLQSLASVDAAIGRILTAVEASGAAGETAIVIGSDHGESFGEHGVNHHFNNVYEEESRIPLIFRVPGVAPLRVPGPVSLLDLGPTVAELLGVRWTGEMHGMSLVPFLLGAPFPADRDVMIDLAKRSDGVPTKVALVRGGHKLVLNVPTGSFELYDLRADPGERDNLYDEASPIAIELRRRMAATRAAAEPDPAPKPAARGAAAK